MLIFECYSKLSFIKRLELQVITSTMLTKRDCKLDEVMKVPICNLAQTEILFRNYHIHLLHT